MTQVWENDIRICVTIVKADPCRVVQLKNVKTDGYEAVQVGHGVKREKNIKKPQKGHLKKVGILSADDKTSLRNLREFRVDGEDIASSVNVGDSITVDTFDVGDEIDVVGVSKGKGFAGVVKRYGFKGAITTHGTKDQVRMPGSIGATGPARVFKGTRMGGRMGDERVTIKNLKIIRVDNENNHLYIKGAVPGARNGLLMIKGAGELKVVSDVSEKVEVASEKQDLKVEEKS